MVRAWDLIYVLVSFAAKAIRTPRTLPSAFTGSISRNASMRTPEFESLTEFLLGRTS